MLILKSLVSLWLNECDGCVTLQAPELRSIHDIGESDQNPPKD